jgi:hypothetical protein
MCDKVQAPNKDSIYSAISQHWVHSEQIRWTLLSSLLTANSILLVAWATIFASTVPAWARESVLVAFASAGFLLSFAWIGIVLRSRWFVERYAKLGREAEALRPQAEGQSPAVRAPFTSAKALRSEITGFAKIAESRRVLLAVPIVFALLYLFLICVSPFGGR